MSIFKKRKLKTLLEQEMRLAYFLVLPTFFLIFSIVLIPLLANFWISLKPINLEDLRAPQLILKHKIRGNLEVSGDKGIFDIRFRNSSQKYDLEDVKFKILLPEGIKVLSENKNCVINSNFLICNYQTIEKKNLEDYLLNL